MSTGTVVGVLLAAGQGRRMGRPKATLDIDGQPAWRRAAAVLHDGGCQDVVVVTGAVAATPGAEPWLHLHHHPGWADGMGTTMRAAFALPMVRAADAAVVHLVDLPDVTPAAVARLVERWRAPDAAPVQAATFGGRRRNPVLFAQPVVGEVAAQLDGDAGARRWLDANRDRVGLVACDDVGSAHDLDTPEDLDRWRDSRHVPTPADPARS